MIRIQPPITAQAATKRCALRHNDDSEAIVFLASHDYVNNEIHINQNTPPNDIYQTLLICLLWFKTQ